MGSGTSSLNSPLAEGVACGDLTIIHEVEDLCRRLEQSFPFVGSQIDWTGLPNAVTGVDDSSGARARFFRDQTRGLNPGQAVYYINDGGFDVALSASLAAFIDYLDPILGDPQHHYFVAHDFSWIIVFNMEGDMDFANSPASVAN